MNTNQTISRDEIANRAYAIWQARGCPPGDGAEDWRAAERELLTARVGREDSTRTRLQAWWQRVRERIAG